MAEVKETTTLAKVYNAYVALGKLAKREYPPHVSYIISSNMRSIHGHSEAYEEFRNGLLIELGTQSDTPGKYILTSANAAKFNARLEEFGNAEITISFNTVKLSDMTIGTPAEEMEPVLFMFETEKTPQ